MTQGPKGTFAPVTWFSRRQQHVARSTADAELNALSEGLYEEALPVLINAFRAVAQAIREKTIARWRKQFVSGIVTSCATGLARLSCPLQRSTTLATQC